MQYLKNYENFSNLNENIFNNIIDKISNIFNNKSKTKIKNDLISILTEYKNIFIEKKTSRKELKNIIKKLKIDLGEDIVFETNLDNFFRGIYNISIKEKNKEKLEKYFNKYIKSLDSRLERIYNKEYWKNKYKDDEQFDELKKLKKEKILKIGKKQFIIEKEPLQVELLKLQEWLKNTGNKIALIFEGRDAAGKGSAIKTITEYLDPKYFEIATFGIPSEEEQKNWFKRYEKKLPKPGHITFFDRSWYNRAVNDPVMGYCDEEQYREFMHTVNPFEDKLIREGYILMKFWFSIDKDTQQLRFNLRKVNPLKYWKYSPNDEKTIPKWDLFTNYKEQMFQRTSTKNSPWVIVDSNDKRIAQLNVMRYILNNVDYDNKGDVGLTPYPEVVFELK